ncbi:hypothetical protein [Caballeronia sp. GAWG2-1]|uniref:hypothetical protein n=1 Tax=Caballeronia sp. GAWG2-1 TaxID=2921744 RepID=UPI002027E5CF|nr:hypothetical protein [Caballeronia sp. GAWG2-1]
MEFWLWGLSKPEHWLSVPDAILIVKTPRFPSNAAEPGICNAIKNCRVNIQTFPAAGAGEVNRRALLQRAIARC